MSESTIRNWVRQLVSGRPAKRMARPFSRWSDQGEVLEERQVLSAVVDLPVAAEVGTADADHGKKAGNPKHGKKVEYPNVTGVWNLTAVVTINDDEPFELTGTVNVTQKKGKITANVTMQELPPFTIKGKLGKTNTSALSGSTKFPVDIGDGDFRFIKGDVTINYAQGFASFTGSINRTIFGQTINVTLTGTKQS